jgi:hypothetical protein
MVFKGRGFAPTTTLQFMQIVGYEFDINRPLQKKATAYSEVKIQTHIQLDALVASYMTLREIVSVSSA